MASPKKPAARKRAAKKPKKATTKKPAKASQPPALVLPDRQIRTSERSNFKRCRWMWSKGYVEHLKPVREAPALKFGTLIHEALELRYPPGKQRGPKPAETFERIFKERLDEIESTWKIRADEEFTDALDLGVDMLEMFVEEYGRDEEWEVIESEMTFQVPALDPVTGEALFTYVGTMDGVWRNRMDGGIRIIDWKTTASDPTKVGHLILDEQATAYWTWGADYLIQSGIIKEKDRDRLDGMLYTFMRKGKRDPRPQDAQGYYLNLPTKKEKEEFGDDYPGSRSKKQPAPYFHRELVYRSEFQREKARERVAEEFSEIRKVETGEETAFKTPGSGPQSHCNWCSFRDICELDEIGADADSLQAATMTTWDPYAAHEIQEEGK